MGGSDRKRGDAEEVRYTHVHMGHTRSHGTHMFTWMHSPLPPRATGKNQTHAWTDTGKDTKVQHTSADAPPRGVNIRGRDEGLNAVQIERSGDGEREEMHQPLAKMTLLTIPMCLFGIVPCTVV